MSSIMPFEDTTKNENDAPRNNSQALPLPENEDVLLDAEEQAFYSNADAAKEGNDSIWSLLAGAIGNIYELYDFAVYGMFTPEIGTTFFPDSSKELQLVNSFCVYATAFLMRPLGAVLFGELGDRLMGRKYTLIASIILITAPSIMMGILPGYEVWGILSPILLILLRMMQGLSVGGQLAGSYVLSIEQSSANSRGFRGAVCDASSTFGFLLASMAATLVRNVWSDEQVDAWAWRVPFWFSLVLAPVLYYVIDNVEESKAWEDNEDKTTTTTQTEEKNEKQKYAETPQHQCDQKSEKSLAIIDLFRSPFHTRQVWGMIFYLSTTMTAFFLLYVWIPVYLSELRGLLSQADAMLLNMLTVSFHIPMLVINGRWSDTFYHRKHLLRIGICGTIVAAPVMMYMFESVDSSFVGLLIAQLLMALCVSMMHGSNGAYEVESWMADPALTFTGVAVSHNLSACIFGGSMPLIGTYLVYLADDQISEHGMSSHDSIGYYLWRMLPGFYISIFGFISLYCVSYVIRHPHDPHTGVDYTNTDTISLPKEHETKEHNDATQKYQPPVC